MRVANDGAQQRFLDGPPVMNWYDGPRSGLRMDQDQMASLLPILDETSMPERPYDLARGQRWKLSHDQAGIAMGTVTRP